MGGPGVGKSVLCARMIQEVQTKHPSAVTAFQYYSFDEIEVLSNVYRNIAEQLFHELYGQDEEISDEIYYISQGPSNEFTLKILIEIMVQEAKNCYIFLDGLDEEYSDSKRRDAAEELICFLRGLAEQEGSTIKLWFSSQDRRKLRDSLAGAAVVELSAQTNSQDIEAFFTEALSRKDFTELSGDSKRAILGDLRKQVHGNFLWASMMVETISEATSSKELLLAVKNGLPEDFEVYLEKKVKAFKNNLHCFLRYVPLNILFVSLNLHDAAKFYLVSCMRSARSFSKSYARQSRYRNLRTARILVANAISLEQKF
jgi:hypothetical protein